MILILNNLIENLKIIIIKFVLNVLFEFNLTQTFPIWIINNEKK